MNTKVNVFGDRIVRARMLHVCHFCGAPIAKGVYYVLAKYNDIESIKDIHMHAKCYDEHAKINKYLGKVFINTNKSGSIKVVLE